MPKMISTRMISERCGTRGFGSSPAARMLCVMTDLWPRSELGRWLENEGERDAEDGEGLGESEAEDGDRLQPALHLGLARGAADVRRKDQADADTRADGRETVADHVQ